MLGLLPRTVPRAPCWRHTRPLRALRRAIVPEGQEQRRAMQSQPGATTEPSKSYDAILREMDGRAAQWNVRHKTVHTSDLRQRLTSDELYKPLDVGDLALLNLDPVVVLSTPSQPDGPYIVADAVGRAKEVFSNMIDARLMSLVSPSQLALLETSLFAPESAAADPALEADVEPSVTSRAPTARVVSQPVHRITAVPLREMYTRANLRAKSMLPAVVNALNRRQQSPSKTCSFVDLLLEVCPSSLSTYSAVDFYAARLCLDHYTLAHKVLLDFSYTGRYALTVLPHSVETRNIQVVHSSKPSQARNFIVDYACGNLPGGSESEARAIELLRELHPTVTRIDPATAAELLQLPRGGVDKRLRHKWFHDGSSLSLPTTHDRMQQLRQEFEHPVYCIDSADVFEIDDGISLQRQEDNVVKLGIHIADPSAITNNRELVKDVLKRPTSVYKPDNTAIAMLPRALTERLDLIKDGQRAALSLFVDVDLRTMAFSNVEFKPLTLKNVINITPDEVLVQRHKFSDFDKVAQALRHHRFRSGAFALQFRPGDGFASVIVSEFMVLANHLAAQYCHELDIPIFYRSQRVFTQSQQLRRQYDEALREHQGRLGFKWRPAIQKSLVSITPRPHMGIGYSMTTRFTSPLRRLEDFITHSQIAAHLRGEALPFSSSDLACMVPWLQVSQELVKEYQTQLQTYSALSLLKRGEKLEGIVSRVPWDISTGAARPRIYLPQYEVEVDYLGSAPLAIDEKRVVVVDSVSVSAGSAGVLLVGESRTAS